MRHLSIPLGLGALVLVCFSMTAADADVNILYSDPADGWSYSFLGDGDAYAYEEYTDPQYGKQQYQELDWQHLDGTWNSHNGLEQWDHGESGENRLIGTSIPAYIAPGFSGPLPAGAAQGPAPGGVLAVEDNGTTYLRIQDVGDPLYPWSSSATGWQHGSEDTINSYAETWNTNKKLLFNHDISAGGTTNLTIVDDGVTISFRARLSTLAADPDAALDPLFPTQDPQSPIYFGPPGPHPWPAGGDGDIISHHGNGHFGIAQTIYGNDDFLGAQIGFSLARNNDLNQYGAGELGSGLIMNDATADAVQDPFTSNMQTNAGSTNIVSIPDDELDEWHEFWITIEEDGITGNDATHEVNVYMDGEETPQTFYVTASGMSPAIRDYDNGQQGVLSYLEMGHSRFWNSSAIDVDFFSYKEGVFAPTSAQIPGDFDRDGDVDGDDFLTWQQGFGTIYDGNDFLTWQSNFPFPGGGNGAGAVPEPASTTLLLLFMAATGVLSRRGGTDRQMR